MAGADLPWFKVYAAETLSDENFQGKHVIAQLRYSDNNIVSIREMMDPQRQRESMVANAGKCAGLWSTEDFEKFLKGEDED